MISLIEPSWFEAGTAYAAIDAHRLDDFKPYVFKPSDFGKTWSPIASGLPDGSYVHAVREDPKRQGLLYAGTETGAWVSFDDGSDWQALQLNLPTAAGHALIIHGDDLGVATHGRRFGVRDDISPLRQSNASIAAEDAHLFASRAAIRTRMGRARRRRYAIGENPPDGASLYYYLKEEPKEHIKLEVLDAQGKAIRAFTSEEQNKEGGSDEWERDEAAEHIPAKAGLNEFTWDLRYEPPKKIPAAIYDEGEPSGPLALPGNYQVRLAVGAKNFTAPLEVTMDPRVKTSAEDLRKQFDLMLKMRDRQDEMNKAILAIRDLRAQLQTLEKRLGSSEPAKPVVAAAVDLRKKISAIEEELIQVNSKASEDELNYPTKLNSKLGYLQNAVDSADAPPTEGEIGVYAELDLQLESQLAKWRDVLSKDVPALNEAMQKNNVPLIAPTTAKAN